MAKSSAHPKNQSLAAGFVLASLAASTVLAGAAPDASGQPTKTFVKDVIRTGDWVDASGIKFTVTPDRIDNWVAQFSAMQAEGIKVPIPDGHTFDAAKNLGWVVGMFRDGDTLKASMQFVGNDAILAASRNDVSAYIKEVKRGTGKTFTDAIEHICLTPVPMIPGLGPFVAIAASAGAQPQQVPVLRLATETNMTPIQQIAQALGIDATGMDDAALLTAILAKTATMATASTDAEKAKQDATQAKTALSAARTQITALEAAKGKPIEVDPDVLDTAVDSVTTKLNSLVEAKAITPKCREALALALVGTAEARPAICLSRKAAAAAGFGAPLANTILEALKLNDGMALALASGEKTKGQAIALSRDNADANGDSQKDPGLQNRINAQYGLPKAAAK